MVAAWYEPSCWQLGTGRTFAPLLTLTAQLRAEYALPPSVASTEMLRFLLATLMLHVDRLPTGSSSATLPGAELYARFRAELERSYLTTRRLEDYAARLGYSVKTLSRACQSATGASVKGVIDGRVALQAKRLLVHTDDPVATIARKLGFSEPTNFGKFFTRRTGFTPGDFRLSLRD